jgi:hypothetical protein
MLCDTCQRKRVCVPLHFSQKDEKLQHMMENLKQCDLRVEAPTVNDSGVLKTLVFKLRQAIAH